MRCRVVSFGLGGVSHCQHRHRSYDFLEFRSWQNTFAGWPGRTEGSPGTHDVRHTEFRNAFDETVETEVSLKANERVEQVLRWHLRRFVDPEWIDRRLKTVSPS
jgi:hypothetical protein